MRSNSPPSACGGNGEATKTSIPMPICDGCDRHIDDLYTFNLLEKQWHAKCIRCHACHVNLTDKCFYSHGEIYCRDDYFRRFGPKCAGCGGLIGSNDLVQRRRVGSSRSSSCSQQEDVFHLHCFRCCMCQRVINGGDELFATADNRLMCKEDYERFRENTNQVVNIPSRSAKHQHRLNRGTHDFQFIYFLLLELIIKFTYH